MEWSVKQRLPMGPTLMKYPFEVPFEEIEADPDTFISAIFSCLESRLSPPLEAGYL